MTGTIDKKAPPHNKSAEQYVLGMILVDSPCLPTVTSIIQPNDLYFDRHAQILGAFMDLHDLGQPIDIATVAERLKSKGHGREDDFSYLLEISDPYGASVKNAVASATLIKQDSLRRRQQRLDQRRLEQPNLDREKIKAEEEEIEAERARLDGQKKDSWEIFTAKDAYKKREPLQFVIAGLFTLPSSNIVYGSPATLKTFFSTDAAVCVAGGIPFLGRDVIHCPSMLIDFDNGARRTHERIESLLRGHGLPDTTPFYYASMPNPWLNAGNLRDVESLIQRIKDRGVKFVVIDNLGLISGDADENSADMIHVMGHLRLVAERTAAAICTIHHERKSTGTGGRAGDAVRGHSSIEAALDLALQVEREEHSNIVTIKSTKTRDTDVLPFATKFCFEHKTGTGELSTALFVPFEIEDTTSDRAIERIILETLTEKPLLNQKQLFSDIKPSLEAGTHRIRSVLEKLEKCGRVVINNGNHGAKLYTVD